MTGEAAGTEAGHAGVFQTLRETPLAARFALLGVFVNQFGAFVQFFVVLYLTERGFSNAQAGLALGAYSVGAISGVLFGGGLSDRLGPRRTIVLSMASAGLATLSVTALDSFAAIVVAVALSGAMTQAARPPVSALLFGLVPPARQVMVFAMYRTALNTGMVAGPLVAAWLSTISWDLVFWFDAATALVYCAIAAVLLPNDAAAQAQPQDEAAAAAESDQKDQKKAGYLHILADRRYLAYLALMLANGLVHVQFFAVLPLMLKAAGYPTWAYGTASAVSALIVITLELRVTRTTQHWPAWIAVITGWVFLVLGRGAFGLPGGLAIVIVGTALAAIGETIGAPAVFAYPAKVAPAGAVGRYLGSAHATFQLGYAIGPIVGVLLWTALGDGFWAVCCAFGLAMVVPGIWGMRPPMPTNSDYPQVTYGGREID
ncbi:MAG: MFS transporter [Sporichthyaceae bacterium]|nr:MFS transporter [Sporichthyaceae bacterium]